MPRPYRPKGLSLEEAFRWYMPEDPPPAPSPREGCWDWTGSLCTRGGYGSLSVYIDGRTRTLAAHRASYLIFNGEITKGLWVLHSCDRPACCQPAHLHLGTQTENMREAIERNRIARGERAGTAKLTDEQVLWIRQSPMKQKELADMFAVSQPLISMIRAGKTRAHLAADRI